MGKQAPTPDVEAVVSGSGHVLTGNTDIQIPEWNPPQGAPERPVLPGCEHEPNLPVLDGVMRRIAEQMQADGLIGGRRLGVGQWAWNAARATALGSIGLAYFLAAVLGVALIDDFMNGPRESRGYVSSVRG